MRVQRVQVGEVYVDPVLTAMKEAEKPNALKFPPSVRKSRTALQSSVSGNQLQSLDKENSTSEEESHLWRLERRIAGGDAYLVDKATNKVYHDGGLQGRWPRWVGRARGCLDI